MAIQYPTLQACRKLLFPLIKESMANNEPAPHYASERSGLNRLESIFSLMQTEHYESLHTKAAYLFTSVIDGHPFSNGNKRLAVTLLTYFLIINEMKIHAHNMEAVRLELRRIFPKLRWEEVHAFKFPHEFFFYHLALIIADRQQKGQMTFRQEQSAVTELLKFITLQ